MNNNYQSIVKYYDYLVVKALTIESALDLLTLDNPDYLINPKDASALLGLSRSQIYQLLKHKKLKGYKINKFWMIHFSYINEYIENYVIPKMNSNIFPVLTKKRGNI
jgi:excisionase family DNA binding protein